MNLKKSLTENLGVKIIALVVALFIWIYASNQKEVVWLKMIPVSLVNVPDSLIVTGNVPEEVEISVTCSKWRKTLSGFKRFGLSVDLSDAVPGRQRVSLTPRQIQLPAKIKRVNVRVIEPLSLDIRLERLVTRRTQVILSTSGSVSESLVLLDGAVSITPSWVTVRGPASTVQHIRTVTTETLDLGKIKESVERELPLDIDRDHFECEPDRVTVSVRVSPLGERVLANVPPTVLIDSEDYSVTVMPNTVTLTLSGPRAVLDTLSSGDVSVLLNLGGLAEARYRMAPEIILPPGVNLTSMSVDSLSVEIAKDTDDASP
jgi:YbbR domain-containing protein